MSHKTAFWIAVAITLFFAYDGLVQDWSWSFILAMHGLDFMEWLKFWR